MATRASNDTPDTNAEKAVATEAKAEGFKPVKLKHRDGREQVATNPRELVSAKFDGFAVK